MHKTIEPPKTGMVGTDTAQPQRRQKWPSYPAISSQYNCCETASR